MRRRVASARSSLKVSETSRMKTQIQTLPFLQNTLLFSLSPVLRFCVALLQIITPVHHITSFRSSYRIRTPTTMVTRTTAVGPLRPSLRHRRQRPTTPRTVPTLRHRCSARRSFTKWQRASRDRITNWPLPLLCWPSTIWSCTVTCTAVSIS